jgi:hypothetical protein
VLGVEILLAQLGIVEDLGADLGAADEVRHLGDLGQGKASGGGAVEEPHDVGLAGAGEVVALLHGPICEPGKRLTVRRPPDCFSRSSDQRMSPLRHGVLVAHEVGELHLDLLL